MASEIREQDLASKVAVVTGASKGIGRAIAINLARRGCAILGTCSKPETLHLIASLADEIAALYESSAHAVPQINGIVADIHSATTPREIADALKKDFGGYVNIYINNAASTTAAGIGSLNAEHIATSCLGNIQTPAMTVEELVKRRMFRKESRIVFISSTRARQGIPETTMYNITKSAGESLVRCWANAFGGKDPAFDFMAGTTANSVAVGVTMTDAITRFGPELLERIQARHLPAQAVPRIAEPEDIADVVGLLCCEQARWITGSVVSANAGEVKIL